jgi:hypothetical protein
MQDVIVRMKDGRQYQGPLHVWRPEGGWFSLMGEYTERIQLAEVLSAINKNQMVMAGVVEDVDLLERAIDEGWIADGYHLLEEEFEKVRREAAAWDERNFSGWHNLHGMGNPERARKERQMVRQGYVEGYTRARWRLNNRIKELGDQLEQVRTQLGGCTVAATGNAVGDNDAQPGDYGHSAAFDDVKKLYARAKELDEWRAKLEDTLVKYREKLKSTEEDLANMKASQDYEYRLRNAHQAKVVALLGREEADKFHRATEERLRATPKEEDQ